MPKRYITTTSGLRGFFAVVIEEDYLGFAEPIITSPFSHPHKEQAERDAKEWAKSENIPYQN